MTGDGGEYLRPEDLRELGDDSLPSSQFLDGMNYLRYSLEGGRSDRYLPGHVSCLLIILHSICCKHLKSLSRGPLSQGAHGTHLVTVPYQLCQCASCHFAEESVVRRSIS